MQCRSSEDLQLIVEEARKYAEKGKVANYIPELGKANRDDLAIALSFPDGNCLSAGNIEKRVYTSKHF